MKNIKCIPFILLLIGTFGLLAVELFVIAGSRCLTLTFAGVNVLGFVLLFVLHKKPKI